MFMRDRFVILVGCVIAAVCLNVAAVETPSNFVDEPAKQVPVIYDVYVVVAGGGILSGR
jgi:hypothetical protein